MLPLQKFQRKLLALQHFIWFMTVLDVFLFLAVSYAGPQPAWGQAFPRYVDNSVLSIWENQRHISKFP